MTSGRVTPTICAATTYMTRLGLGSSELDILLVSMVECTLVNLLRSLALPFRSPPKYRFAMAISCDGHTEQERFPLITCHAINIVVTLPTVLSTNQRCA
jgi:hypothetical protein